MIMQQSRSFKVTEFVVHCMKLIVKNMLEAHQWANFLFYFLHAKYFKWEVIRSVTVVFFLIKRLPPVAQDHETIYL